MWVPAPTLPYYRKSQPPALGPWVISAEAGAQSCSEHTVTFGKSLPCCDAQVPHLYAAGGRVRLEQRNHRPGCASDTPEQPVKKSDSWGPACGSSDLANPRAGLRVGILPRFLVDSMFVQQRSLDCSKDQKPPWYCLIDSALKISASSPPAGKV